MHVKLICGFNACAYYALSEDNSEEIVFIPGNFEEFYFSKLVNTGVIMLRVKTIKLFIII